MGMGHFLRIAVLTPLLTALVACSGGSTGASDTGTNGDTTVSVTYAVEVDLVDDSGNPVRQVAQGMSYHAIATVLEQRTSTSPGFPGQTISDPAVGVAVTFTTTSGVFAPVSGSAVTSEDGHASVILTVGGEAGAATLTASAKDASDSIDFAVASTLEPTLEITLLNSDGSETSVFGPAEHGRILILAHTVETNADGSTTGELVPAANTLITVSSDGGTTDPTNGVVTTDEAGLAELGFQASTTGGGYMMNATATINGDEAATSVNFRVAAPDVSIGVFEIENANLGSGGTTAVRVTVLGPDDEPYEAPLEVQFTSVCAANGAAIITPSAMTVNGQVVANYTATTCTGRDTITASVIVPGRSLPLTASGDVQIAPPTAGSIVFVKADPTGIALAGRGSAQTPEISTVTFQVTSVSGAPVPGVLVRFSLTSQAGGLRLLGTQGQTDSAGNVSVKVQSGAIPTVFRVVATVPDTGISTQSGQITVSTGYAVQGSMSISASELNPEAWNYDGVTVDVMARAADLFGNPVPDGTVVQFTAEGGSIEPTCSTVNGACQVMWRSQAPRPQNGRVTLLATTAGDERFTDTNGNGVFDGGTDTWQDLAEAWRDDNENNQYEVGEFYLDKNANNAHGDGNGLYDGAMCPGSYCGISGAVDVRDDIVLTMSSSNLIIRISPDPIQVNDAASQSVRIEISDVNGNLPPVGTTVQVEASQGEVTGADDLTVGNSNGSGPWVAIVTVSGSIPEADPEQSGRMTVTATTPAGSDSMAQAVILDGATAGGGGGCNFSPCAGGGDGSLQSSFYKLIVSSEHVDMRAGEIRDVPLGVSALALANGDSHWVANAKVVMTCSTMGGIAITPHRTTFLTSPNSLEDVRLRIVSIGPGAGVCRFQAGSHSTKFTVQAE